MPEYLDKKYFSKFIKNPIFCIQCILLFSLVFNNAHYVKINFPIMKISNLNVYKDIIKTLKIVILKNCKS